MSVVPTISCTLTDKKMGSVENVRQKRSFLTALAIAFLLFGGSIWTAAEAVTAASSLEAESFAALTLQGLYFSLAILLRHMRRPISLFEPYTMVTLVYVLVYHVAPVFQFSAGNTARYGVDAMPQTVEAVILVIVGHFFFTLAYGFVGRKKRKAFCLVCTENPWTSVGLPKSPILFLPSAMRSQSITRLGAVSA